MYFIGSDSDVSPSHILCSHSWNVPCPEWIRSSYNHIQMLYPAWTEAGRYFRKFTNTILQEHYLIQWISMIFQIISAWKSILAKLFYLLARFIGAIGNQISIHICISQFPGLTIFSQNLKVSQHAFFNIILSLEVYYIL